MSSPEKSRLISANPLLTRSALQVSEWVSEWVSELVSEWVSWRAGGDYTWASFKEFIVDGWSLYCHRWRATVIESAKRRGTSWDQSRHQPPPIEMLLIDWLIDLFIYWLIDWLVDWLIDWLIEWMIEWMNEWLIDVTCMLTPTPKQEIFLYGKILNEWGRKF